MSFIISSLKMIGLCSGGYIGYMQGFIYKNKLCSNAIIKKYDDWFINSYFNENTMSENVFYNYIGLFSGVCIGYYIYPIIIPTMLFHLYNIDEIKKYIDNIK